MQFIFREPVSGGIRETVISEIHCMDKLQGRVRDARQAVRALRANPYGQKQVDGGTVYAMPEHGRVIN